MHIPGFTEGDIRSTLTIEDEENLTQDQIDTLTGLWTDIFDAILAAYTPAHAPMGESEIAAIKQIDYTNDELAEIVRRCNAAHSPDTTMFISHPRDIANN